MPCQASIQTLEGGHRSQPLVTAQDRLVDQWTDAIARWPVAALAESVRPRLQSLCAATVGAIVSAPKRDRAHRRLAAPVGSTCRSLSTGIDSVVSSQAFEGRSCAPRVACGSRSPARLLAAEGTCTSPQSTRQALRSTQSLCKAPAPESRVRHHASPPKPSLVPPQLRLALQASHRRPRSHANPKAPVVACLRFSRQCKTQALGARHLLPMRTRQYRRHERRAAPQS